MRIPGYLIFAPLIPSLVNALNSSPNINDGLNLRVFSGGNDNFFLREGSTTAQLLITSGDATNASTSPQRLVVALPAGNNGALAYFLPTHPSGGLAINMLNGTLRSTTDSFDNVGVQADLMFSGNATLGVVIVGAVRAMRDYVEGAGTMHEIFNYTLLEHSPTSLRLHRRFINSTFASPSVSSQHGHPAQQAKFFGVDMYLTAPPGSRTRFIVNTQKDPPDINIIIPNSTPHLHTSPDVVRVRVLTNYTRPVGLPVSQLFLQPEDVTVPALRKALEGLADGTNETADQVSFLTYTDTFVAGGWRFLTYFGRDTLIALRLLMPVLTSEGIESVLGAVIERANITGALCHEETVGDYASFINLGNNQPDLGNQPFYDYKMIDTDLLLLPALSHYFLDLPQGANRSAQFLARNASLQDGTYEAILNRIVNYNLLRALPFAQNTTYTSLLAFRPGQPVGNWRDSNQGTGYGTIPFDVNVALVPANLRAIQKLVAAGLVTTNVQMGGEVMGASEVGQVAATWEQDAPLLFEVNVDGTDSEARLQDFVQKTGLGDGILGNSTGTGNVSFFALSLRDDGSPVEVLHSDLGFGLMYGDNLSLTFMQRVVNALTPYPRGLLTNVGMLIANPAYDSNRTNVQVLDHTAYHGTVVWSFQQALMAGGIARQLNLCAPNPNGAIDVVPVPDSTPEWCKDSGLVKNLFDAQTRLWTSIKGAADNLNTEVWSYSFDPATEEYRVADLTSLSPDGTEADATQLWSYGFLGLADPTV